MKGKNKTLRKSKNKDLKLSLIVFGSFSSAKNDMIAVLFIQNSWKTTPNFQSKKILKNFTKISILVYRYTKLAGKTL